MYAVFFFSIVATEVHIVYFPQIQAVSLNWLSVIQLRLKFHSWDCAYKFSLNFSLRTKFPGNFMQPWDQNFDEISVPELNFNGILVSQSNFHGISVLDQNYTRKQISLKNMVHGTFFYGKMVSRGPIFTENCPGDQFSGTILPGTRQAWQSSRGMALQGH